VQRPRSWLTRGYTEHWTRRPPRSGKFLHGQGSTRAKRPHHPHGHDHLARAGAYQPLSVQLLRGGEGVHRPRWSDLRSQHGLRDGHGRILQAQSAAVCSKPSGVCSQHVCRSGRGRLDAPTELPSGGTDGCRYCVQAQGPCQICRPGEDDRLGLLQELLSSGAFAVQ